MKKAILFFVILCAILGYFIFIRDTTIVADINTTEVKNNQANPVSSDKPRAQTKSVSPNNTAVKTSTRVATPNINQTALPAIDLPLVQSLPLLISESESGNAKASCRLAAQIFMCKVKTIQKTDVWQKVLAEQKIAAQLGMKVFEDLAEWTDNEINIKSKTERDVLKAKICDGFDASLALQPWEYQFRAALQGHVASMAQFAISPPLIPSIHFVADAAAWKAYRENASSFLKSAADKGNIRANIYFG